MRKWSFPVFIAALWAGLASPVSAGGFHYEIDVTSQLVEDSAGNLTGLRLGWLYDQAVSEVLLDGEDLSAGQRAATLKMVAERIITDLYDYRYYTHLKMGGQESQFVTVTDYRLDLTPDKRLKLDFLLPLAKPLTLAGKQLDIELIDPAGTGVLLYRSANDVSTGPTRANCQITLEAYPDYAHGEAPQTAHLQCQ